MRLSANCFALLGFAYIPPWAVNAGFVVGQTHTLIVDSGPNALAAATLHGYATAVRPDNSLMVINTELHLDHISGNDYFRQHGLDVYGHPAWQRTDEQLADDVNEYNNSIPDSFRRQLQEGQIPFINTHIANPNNPIMADTSFDLGGLAVQIILTPGHTPTNLTIFVPSDGVLFCGDCLVRDYLPNLESGTAQDWQMWLQSLERIRALKPEIIVPGHGRVLQKSDIQPEIERIRQILKEAMAKN
jgi:glyoxylase-like metal-dependent hydrolase (beta-lactamase superfamily II)